MGGVSVDIGRLRACPSAQERKENQANWGTDRERWYLTELTMGPKKMGLKKRNENPQK